MRRDQQLRVAGQLIVELKEIKDCRHVLTDSLVRSQQRKIGIQPRGFLVEVTRADMAVVPNLPLLAALNRKQFAVHLESRNPKYHLYASLG